MEHVDDPSKPPITGDPMVPLPVAVAPAVPPDLFKWDEILSWNSVGWWIALLIAVWGVLMGTGDYDLANVFFALAGGLFIAQWGRITSIHQPKRRVVLFLIGTAIAASLVTTAWRWTSHKAVEARGQREQLARLELIPTLNTSIDTLKSGLQQAETGRQVDAAYFKAKLEDAYKVNDDLRQFAPAIMKLAETSADLGKKQYDQKVLGNSELKSFSVDVIKRMRELENQYQLAERQQSDANWQKLISRPRQPAPSDEDRRKQAIADQQEEITSYTLLRSRYEQLYRSTIMGDAQYSRRELLNRIGGDAFLSPRDKSKSIALDGILAGPAPIGDGADYLDALVRKLSP